MRKYTIKITDIETRNTIAEATADCIIYARKEEGEAVNLNIVEDRKRCVAADIVEHMILAGIVDGRSILSEFLPNTDARAIPADDTEGKPAPEKTLKNRTVHDWERIRDLANAIYEEVCREGKIISNFGGDPIREWLEELDYILAFYWTKREGTGA